MMLQKKGWAVFPAFTAIILLSGAMACAQVLTPDPPGNRSGLLSEEQFAQGHFMLAAQSARMYLANEAQNISDKNFEDKDRIRYYLALSFIKGNLSGCTDSVIAVINTTLDLVYTQRLSFALAQYYFLHNDLAMAIPWYERAGIENLNNTEIADQKFELAYCYFNNRQFDKAKTLFYSIKELKGGKYYLAGNYYYGLLAYDENNYKEALKSFEQIKDLKEYRNIVPYYIAELYYFMGSREKALAEAKTLIKRAEKSFYDNELHLLAAQCLFEDQKYKEALPYFEYYYDHAEKIRKEDLYEMAYCDYKTNDWQKAIEKFKLLNSEQDSLGQSSMYFLGDCYLKAGNKQSARNAFGICADISFNKSQQEAAMILYAMLSYETGYNDEALRQLNTMLAAFPYTQYKDEANTLISGLLLKTNNYSEAITHLDIVAHKDERYWQIYQKATFGYAVQLYREGDLVGAGKYFSYSLQHSESTAYDDAACFWMGELSFHLQQMNEVITWSQKFISGKSDKSGVEKISPLATVQHAYLNMGYAAMETQNYAAAQTYFNHAEEGKGNDVYSGAVASLREADAVFMQKKYPRAISLYDNIISTDATNADYARYQKGILLGLQGKNTEKISQLKLLAENKASAYSNAAHYEIAVTYMEEGQYAQSLSYLQQLTDIAATPDKTYAPKAWMKRGYIEQLLHHNEKAIAAYKKVVTDYPASFERLPALDALKSLYIQSDQPGAYAQMLKDNNLPAAENGVVDSTYYAAAETQFSGGKWEDARQAFTNYLQQYPNGIFAVKAHYYRAETNYQMKNYKAAMEDYNIVLSTPWNDFSDNSARHAANIAYNNKDYQDAYTYFLKIHEHADDDQSREIAYSGLIKSGFYSGKYRETRLYADSLLAFHDNSAETINDALFLKARSLQHFDSGSEAIIIYKQLSNNKNGETAAESRYHIAEILLQEGKPRDAEKAANETIQLSAGYDYWIVRSYLLLADILISDEDYFNAKATLGSIVKHTKIAALKQEAITKLNTLKTLEKHHSKLSGE